MVFRSTSRPARRLGAAAVEFSLVLPILIMLIFGIYEYGRFVFLWTTATNAARDGARFGAVNCSTTVTSIAGANGLNANGVLGVVDAKMGGTQGMFTAGTYNRVVIYVDPTTSGLLATPPVFQQYSKYGGAEGWKNTIFPDKVGVTITGAYRPVIATILKMSASYNVKINAMCTAEN